MRKKLLIAVPLMVVLLAAGWWVYFYSGLVQYPIFWAYQFPSEAELEKLHFEEKVELCAVPEETISKMTTDALLETYLDYPNINFFRFFSHTFFYSDWFEDLKTNHYFGMAELMEREDLCKSILKRYKGIQLYKKPIDQNLSWEKQLALYPKELQGAIDMFFLELLAAQYDLNDGDRVKETLRKTIEKRVEEKSNYDAYSMPYQDIYYRALDNERSKQRRPNANPVK